MIFWPVEGQTDDKPWDGDPILQQPDVIQYHCQLKKHGISWDWSANDEIRFTEGTSFTVCRSKEPHSGPTCPNDFRHSLVAGFNLYQFLWVGMILPFLWKITTCSKAPGSSRPHSNPGLIFQGLYSRVDFSLVLLCCRLVIFRRAARLGLEELQTWKSGDRIVQRPELPVPTVKTKGCLIVFELTINYYQWSVNQLDIIINDYQWLSINLYLNWQ